MGSLTVAVLVGSIRKDSYNGRLARAIERLASPDLTFRHIRIDDLPLYSQDLDEDYPASARRLKADIETCQALLFVTPEHNQSVPGALKNAIDFASHPNGSNSFSGKPAAVISTSIYPTGGAICQQHMRSILSHLNVPVLAQPDVFLHFASDPIDAEGNIHHEGVGRLLRGFVERYTAWVKCLSGCDTASR